MHNPLSNSTQFFGVQERNESGGPLDKYNSLIQILKGHEEFTLDQNGIIISSNLEVVNVTGYEESEIIGKPISIFYPEDDGEKAQADLNKAARLKRCVVTGLRQKKRGAAFWAKMIISAVYDQDNVVAYKVILKDATHKLISNAKIQTLRDEYLTIFNNPFVGIFKFRMSDKRALMCNNTTLKLINKDSSEQLLFNDLFLSQFQFDRFINLLLEKKRVDGFKFLVKSPNDFDNYAVLSAKYFEGRDFIEGVVVDISEQYNQSIELNRVAGELDNFIYHASHDLRSPLTSIFGLINLAKLDPGNSLDYINMISNRAQHLDNLLHDLVYVTYNSKSEVIVEPIQFRQEIEAILNENIHIVNSLKLDISVDQELSYFSDSMRIRTILRNLISNAFKYRKPSAVHKVTIRVKVEKKHVAIQINDTGLGIEWSQKDRIWDMFYRGTTESTGTGLGLYIVKSMVEKLSGFISFASTLFHGSTFLITIPNAIEENLHQQVRG